MQIHIATTTTKTIYAFKVGLHLEKGEWTPMANPNPSPNHFLTTFFRKDHATFARFYDNGFDVLSKCKQMKNTTLYTFRAVLHTALQKEWWLVHSFRGVSLQDRVKNHSKRCKIKSKRVEDHSKKSCPSYKRVWRKRICALERCTMIAHLIWIHVYQSRIGLRLSYVGVQSMSHTCAAEASNI